ncbi:hypothetical protein MKEN_00408100 [Mycena kentingensis (nom. inval.)]|nr:hypothetical protein MKEN_00408100 [Mycena kentingensis (nom. inval.)]
MGFNARAASEPQARAQRTTTGLVAALVLAALLICVLAGALAYVHMRRRRRRKRTLGKGLEIRPSASSQSILTLPTISRVDGRFVSPWLSSPPVPSAPPLPPKTLDAPPPPPKPRAQAARIRESCLTVATELSDHTTISFDPRALVRSKPPTAARTQVRMPRATSTARPKASVVGPRSPRPTSPIQEHSEEDAFSDLQISPLSPFADPEPEPASAESRW